MREGGGKWRDALTLRALAVGLLLVLVISTTGIFGDHTAWALLIPTGVPR